MTTWKTNLKWQRCTVTSTVFSKTLQQFSPQNFIWLTLWPLTQISRQEWTVLSNDCKSIRIFLYQEENALSFEAAWLPSGWLWAKDIDALSFHGACEGIHALGLERNEGFSLHFKENFCIAASQYFCGDISSSTHLRWRDGKQEVSLVSVTVTRSSLAALGLNACVILIQC